MSSRTFEQPLRVKPKHSKLLAAFLSGVHLLALMMLASLDLPSILMLTAVVAVLLSFYRAVGIYVLFLGARAVRELVWKASGEIIVWDGADREHQASILPDCFVFPWAVILNLRLPDLERRTMVLLPDCVSVDILRQIRVRLRLANVNANQ